MPTPEALTPGQPAHHEPNPVTTLSVRAAHALDLVRAVDPAPTSVASPPVRRFRAQLARTLSATLGVDPARVVATADPDRAHHGHPGHLLSVIDTDGAVYRFVPATPSLDSAFCLLGPCPACGAEVPVTEVTQLADLGRYLATRPSPTELDDHRWDPHHQPHCPHTTTTDAAVGEATTGGRGQIVSATAAVVEPTAPPTWPTTSLAETVADAGPPPAGGIDGVDDVEVDQFLALIRE